MSHMFFASFIGISHIYTLLVLPSYLPPFLVSTPTYTYPPPFIYPLTLHLPSFYIYPLFYIYPFFYLPSYVTPTPPYTSPPSLHLPPLVHVVPGSSRIPLDGFDPPINLTQGVDMVEDSLPKVRSL